uniref:Uncharacterized protein n=1 Tax=Cacopsylla melanoneura TaxID=428564 RepID=A0A8D8YBZ7_9HEMI
MRLEPTWCSLTIDVKTIATTCSHCTRNVPSCYRDVRNSCAPWKPYRKHIAPVYTSVSSNKCVNMKATARVQDHCARKIQTMTSCDEVAGSILDFFYIAS